MMGQGTVGLEIVQDWPEVDVVVVPIGGGGLISGISMAAKSINPRSGSSASSRPARPACSAASPRASSCTLDRVDCVIDGLRVKRVGEKTFEVVRQYVDEIVALPDEQIFDAVVWTMHYAKLVPEGAAAAPVAALLHGLVKAPAGAKVACRPERRQRESRSAEGPALELTALDRTWHWFASRPSFRPSVLPSFLPSFLPPSFPQPVQVATFYDRLVAELRSMPGVQAASTVFPLPLSGTLTTTTFEVARRPLPSGQQPSLVTRLVGQRLFPGHRRCGPTDPARPRRRGGREGVLPEGSPAAGQKSGAVVTPGAAVGAGNAAIAASRPTGCRRGRSRCR